jgi:hypothetical protein
MAAIIKPSEVPKYVPGAVTAASVVLHPEQGIK